MNYKINKIQKDIIIGKVLGDGHLETVNNKTFRLKIEHSIKQKDYVDWLYDELYNLASNKPKIKKQIVQGKEYRKYWFNTGYSASFRFYYHQFYNNKKKVVPKLIHKWLTPLALAVWFMDDGSSKSKKHKAKILNTQSFDNLSLNRLQEALRRRYNIETKLRKQKEGYQIYILASEVDKFKAIIARYILPSFQYKLD